MTTWSEIICEHAMLYIDDVRLQESLNNNEARFLNKMSLYMKNALGLLSRPPELLTYLQDGMVEPTFDDFTWMSESGATVIETGKTGFEVCTVSVHSVDGDEITVVEEAVYDSETGDVTIPEELNSDVEYEIDFYKDGSFNDLTPSMKRLYGLAVAIVWDERFSRNWLNMQPKIKDASFETINESNYMDKVTVRMKENEQKLHDALRKYEQDCAYLNVVSTANKAKHLV